ncbi:hypothetical protein SAMN05519103_08939 [Rhizobiales bacterium GAS113]|nr:hypothetical protein SAMN05519103_08939 [Rhizobiales bacterium GAS113]
MTGHSRSSSTTSRAKRDNPEAQFETPADLASDRSLSSSEKKEALDTWEQDARQLLTASNEGMAAKDEGSSLEDSPKLGQVVREKIKRGEKPKHKPSQ